MSVHPFHSLFRIGISIHNLNKILEKKLGLSMVQWCLLEQLIDMPGASAQSLAKAVGVHPSTLTQTLRRLERKGFIFMTESPGDSRKKLISITKQGKHIFERAGFEMKHWSAYFEPIKDQINHLNLY